MRLTTFFLSIFVLLLANACVDRDPVDTRDAGIWVRFQNETPEDIYDARIFTEPTDSTEIGFIPSGTTSDFIEFESFATGRYEGTTEKFPLESMKATVNGQQVYISSGLWCGTGLLMEDLEAGTYTIGIQRYENDGFVYYLMAFK